MGVEKREQGGRNERREGRKRREGRMDGEAEKQGRKVTFADSSSTHSHKSSPHLDPYLMANDKVLWIDAWDAFSLRSSCRS